MIDGPNQVEKLFVHVLSFNKFSNILNTSRLSHSKFLSRISTCEFSKTTTLLLIFLCILSIDRDQRSRSIQSRISYRFPYLKEDIYITLVSIIARNLHLLSSNLSTPTNPFFSLSMQEIPRSIRNHAFLDREEEAVLFTSPIFISPLTSKPGLLFLVSPL